MLCVHFCLTTEANALKYIELRMQTGLLQVENMFDGSGISDQYKYMYHDPLTVIDQ